MAPPPNTPSPSTRLPLILSAQYRAPSDSPTTQTKTFTHPLPSSLSLHHAPQTSAGTGAGTDTPGVRAAYLSELRSAVGAVQGEINVFLTGRMEEDARKVGDKGVEEEERYGEEEGEEE